MAFKEGKIGAFKVGGTSIPVKSWKCKEVRDGLDHTNTTSSGKREFSKGLTHLEISMEGEWDSTYNPFAAAINIDSADTLSVTLFSDAGGSANVTATLFVESCDIDSPVDGTTKYTISGKSTGSYTLA